MNNFSMKLDLSNFFKDQRSQALVLINAEWSNIKDVQDHIQSLFELRGISLLTEDGCFLPPRESIEVLRAAKGLKAFRFQPVDEDSFLAPAPVSKSSKKRKNRSEEGEISSHSTPCRPLKRSKSKSTNATDAGPSGSNQETEEQCETIHLPLVEDFSSDLSTKSVTLSREESSFSQSLNGKSNSPKHKDVEKPHERKSTRNSKKTIVSTLEMDLDQSVPEEMQETVFRAPLLELDSNTPRIFELPPKKNKIQILENITIKTPHKILDPPPNPGEETLENKEESVLDNLSDAVKGAPLAPEDTNKDLVAEEAIEMKDETSEETDLVAAQESQTNIQLVECEENKSRKKGEKIIEPTDINKGKEPEPSKSLDKKLDAESSEEDILGGENVEKLETSTRKTKNQKTVEDKKGKKLQENSVVCDDSSNSDSDDDVMVVDDTIDESDSDVEAVPIIEVESAQESEIISDLLSTAKKLDSLPVKGDTIVFKLPKVKGQASSGYTEYIAAQCKYVNRRTKMITVDILSSPSDLNRVLRQYANSLDDSTSPVQSINIHFPDLGEAKLVISPVD
ncbi:coilin [Drosophila bipectinata]|uniref:coilin n=1 Tax=Drosophila bipectinata TaxID=42026 RepID=UPI001C89AC62|nr:coilin [Drosophila bipectinata]